MKSYNFISETRVDYTVDFYILKSVYELNLYLVFISYQTELTHNSKKTLKMLYEI